MFLNKQGNLLKNLLRIIDISADFQSKDNEDANSVSMSNYSRKDTPLRNISALKLKQDSSLETSQQNNSEEPIPKIVFLNDKKIMDNNPDNQVEDLRGRYPNGMNQEVPIDELGVIPEESTIINTPNYVLGQSGK